MKDMKNLFKNSKNFMICNPTLPIELLFSMFCRYIDLTKNDLFNVLNSSGFEHQFIQCILSESIHLHTKLISFLTDRYTRDEEHLFDLLYRYFIKNSILCKPCGLFNGVGFGQYSNNTSFTLNSSETKKFVQPDTQWLKKVTKKIEKENMTLLKYKLNKHICMNDKEIIDEILKVIREQLYTDYISFSDLFKLIEKHHQTTEKNVFKHIEYLIEEGYLLSNLRPPLDQANSLDQLIIELESSLVNRNIIDKLKLINLQMNSYSISSVNQSENLYIELVETMVEFMPANKLLDINLKTNFKNNELDEKVVDEINELINLLLMFSNSKINNSSGITALKNNFIEKYGLNREIDLLQCLNENNFLKECSFVHAEAKKISFNKPVERYFKEKYRRCIQFHNRSFSILDDEISDISILDCIYDDIPPYLEISFSVTEDKEGVFHYTVSSPPRSIIDGLFIKKASRMAENYNPMLDHIVSSINDISIDKNEYIFCGISSYCDNENYSAQNKKISIPIISLSDITIGIHNNKFYLRSKSLNKKIIPIFNSVFNDLECSEISKFLYNIIFDDINLEIMPWDVLFGSSPYCPEIKYKRFTLKPETWIINKFYLQIDKRCKFTIFERVMQDYRIRHRIPNLVYMDVGSTRLFLNLDNTQSMKILYREFFSQDSDITFTRYPVDKYHPIKFKDYSYAAELFIPLIKTTKPVS